MNENQTVIAMIPLRGGSKGIPGKNIKNLHGKPLCYWVVHAAISSARISSVYVSTDSPEIMDVVNGFGLGVKLVERPARFASDEASTESVMLHFAEQVEFDTLVTIQATSPFLRADDLDTALIEYEEKRYDSMLSVYHSHDFLWDANGQPLNYDPRMRPRRQEWHGAFVENGAFYITDGDVLAREKCRLGGLIGLYQMDKTDSLDIDTLDDFLLAEALMKQRKSREESASV
ncbi:cytidylyltransferase domain-containing protein [Mycolicibacterium hippocampi]|uniref:Acylneuraminate cytidylyltransferase n=1 Tax=Mycolicibacterium hippocampi TaxID=659824 RepID=A0A7I9ZLM0_9MYCO|nr:acylneuraminate cytidylyltransferase family protein [Mycolicibacterium hippocampi]GFH01925.1 hypothetical protein MHIP_24080 [Mycolicibacterium hippocampi]